MRDKIEAIRKVCKKGEMRAVKLTKVDVKLVDGNGNNARHARPEQ